MGTLHFSAQYQQEPIPLEGNLIKAGWLKEYEIAPSVGDRGSPGHQHRHGDERY